MTTTAVDDAAILLLGDPSPMLRRRVLLELLDVPPADPEVADLTAQVAGHTLVDDHLVADSGDLRSSCFALCRLAYAGLTRKDRRVARLAETILERQQPDGSFHLHDFVGKGTPYRTIPLQTAIPLRGLASVGYAEDARVERGYEWLLARRLSDGSWPTAVASSGHAGYVAGYRRLPAAAGCRANTTGALACLSLHPERSRSQAARTALDQLLQRETREQWTLGSEVARLVGAEPPAGFITFYARFDLAFLLELAGRAGASVEDPRVGELVAFLLDRRAGGGLWPHPTHPELSRWLTFDLLASLRRLEGGDWVGLAFRTPFRAYPRRRRRNLVRTPIPVGPW